MNAPTIKGISRAQAIAARPERLPAVDRKERENGGLLVTVRLSRPAWKQWFGAPPTFLRTFGLDPLGRYVYEMCDGHTTVESIVAAFARKHKVSRAEAEMAVTKFLHTMTRKGMIAIGVPRR